MRTHDQEILDQFTRQANPFADQPAHSTREAIERIVRAAQLDSSCRVLDVACGPGLLSQPLAREAKEVIGCDFTPAMLERAERDREVDNLRYERADVRALPYPDASFDRVVTRFSFHHFEDKPQAMRELVRVCKPGGLVLVSDVVPDADKRAAYDALETLRDPSHTSAWTLDELVALFDGLRETRVERYTLPTALETQLAASFPRPGDGEKIRALMRRDAEDGVDRTSMHAHFEHGAIHFAYPCAIVLGRRP
jgi:ubiquinone/menaquinone biosynthesis C-methylase UbiE